jgi:hypothetical protein
MRRKNMSENVNAPGLVGKNVKDTGRIVSFLIDPSGQTKEALVENNNGQFVRYPVSLLKVGRDEVSMVSDIDKKVETISEQLPTMRKKKKILDKLAEGKVIPQGIHESLSREFDRSLKEMKDEAQAILEDAEKQIKVQDEQLKTLQLARAYLEIEHGIGTVKDEVYQLSVMSILREVKNAQQTKLSLLKTKDKVFEALQEEKETKPEQLEETKEEDAKAPETKPEPAAQPKEGRQALPVRVTEG